MTHKGQGTLVVDTGVGKCKIAIDYIKQSPDIFTVLITSPRENLKKNWAEEIEKWKAESAIDIVADIDSRSNDLLADVYVVLENIQACYKWENKHFDLVILDEVHLCMTPEYSKLLERNDFSHIIGLTATPDITARGKEFKKELFDTLCPIIFSFTDAENHGIVNKAKIIAIDHYLTDEFKVKAGSKIKPFFLGELQQYSYICSQLDKGQRLMASVGSQDFFEDAREWFWEGQGDPKQMTAGRIYLSAIRMRTEFLLNLPSTAKVTVKLAKRLLESQDNKILIFAERIAQIDKMCTYSVHSKNKPEVNDTNLKMFNQGMVRTLGSAYSLTLGLNMKAANVAIFESFQGSETKAVQRKGRLHRLPIDELATMYVIRVKDTRAEKWFNATFDKDEISEVIESKDILQ